MDFRKSMKNVLTLLTNTCPLQVYIILLMGLVLVEVYRNKMPTMETLYTELLVIVVTGGLIYKFCLDKNNPLGYLTIGLFLVFWYMQKTNSLATLLKSAPNKTANSANTANKNASKNASKNANKNANHPGCDGCADCDPDFYSYKNQKPVEYVPRPGPEKECQLANEYRFANGSTTGAADAGGKGVACESINRKYEDHNEQYLKDHYDQFKNNANPPSQELLNKYSSDFVLLGNRGPSGTSQYMSFGGDVNPLKNEDKERSNNAHIPSYTY